MYNITIESKKGNLNVGQMPDLHLGAKIVDFNKINSSSGMYLMWEQQIEDLRKITNILIEKDISVVIVPGDIFDRSSNISEKLQAALQESILAFIKNNIAVVLLTGNHDFPKTREYKALIARYDGIGEYLNVIPIYKASYETVNINDEILIHCIPQCFSKEQFKEEMVKLKSDSDFKVNVFTTHIGVQGAGIEQYEHTEAWINALELNMGFDHVALGDYHRPLKVADKVAYAGVLSNNNFSDLGAKHSVIVYHGDSKQMEFCYYETRGMEQFVIKCKDKTIDDINSELKNISENFNKEKYIKVIFKDITKLLQKQLEFRYILNMKKEAFYCKFVYEYEVIEAEKSIGNIDSTIKSIPEEFKVILGTIITDNDEVSRLFNIYKTKISLS